MACVAVVMAVVGILGLELTTRDSDVLARSAADLVAVHRMQLHAGELARNGSAHSLDEATARFDSSLRELRARELATDELARHAETYRRASDSVARRAFEDELGAIQRSAQQQLDSTLARSTRHVRSAKIALAVTATLGVALGLGLALVAFRRQRRQVEAARAAATAVERATAARTELVGAVARDLRDPLDSVISSTIRLIDAPASDRSRRDLEAIASTSERMKIVIDDLLDADGIETGRAQLDRVRFDASSVLDNAFDIVHTEAAGRAIRIRRIEGKGTVITADRERILQVLVGITRHALKASRVGGDLTLAVRTTGDWARFEIVDRGQPPLPQELAHLFDRAPTPTSGQPRDTSLYICTRLVEAHGGQVGVDVSEPTTYWFTLPLEPRLLE